MAFDTTGLTDFQIKLHNVFVVNELRGNESIAFEISPQQWPRMYEQRVAFDK